jgi:hypothetical protein
MITFSLGNLFKVRYYLRRGSTPTVGSSKMSNSGSGNRDTDSYQFLHFKSNNVKRFANRDRSVGWLDNDSLLFRKMPK